MNISRISKILLFAGILTLAEILFSGVSLASELPTPIQIGLPGENNTAAVSIGKIIKQMIVFTGIFAVMALTYGGILMMVSYGEDSKLKRAKSVMQYALVGVVLSGAAYAIVEALNALSID